MRSTRAWVLLVALVLLLVGLPRPATAQDDDVEATPDVRLVVTSMTGLVGPPDRDGGGAEQEGQDDLHMRVLVENQGDIDVSDLQVVAQVHPRVQGARSRLAQALDEQAVGGESVAIERLDVRDGAELAAGDIAGEEITIGGGDIGWSMVSDVYPVQVSVLYGADVLDHVVTAVVHLADPPEHPLQASVVVPFSSPTSRTAAGRYEQAIPDDLAPGGRLDVLLNAVERDPETPLLLAPETELLEELADRAEGFRLVDGTRIEADDAAAVNARQLLERIRNVVAASPLPPVVGPYGGVDVSALVSTPGPLVVDLAEFALDTARTRAQALLKRAPATQVYLSTTPMTPDGMSLLDVDTTMLLPFEQLDSTVDLVESLNTGTGRHRVSRSPEVPGEGPERLGLVADPRITRALAAPPVEAGPAVARQRLVAETALLYLTRPSVAGRSVLILPPVHWDPARGTAQSMLDAVRSSPWLELVGPSQADAGPFGTASLATSSSVLPAVVTTELIGVREQLEALRAAMPDGLPELDGQNVSDLDDALLRSLTPDALANGGGDALARIQAVRQVSQRAFGDVVLADTPRVTLTSDSGEVPITLQRNRGGPIDLIVEVDSGAGLLWEGEGQQRAVTLPESASRTVAFSARAAARGTFAVDVRVWDPTHRKLLDRSTVSVRSTSISRTALLIIGGVVLVLLVVGARRRRSPTLEVVR